MYFSRGQVNILRFFYPCTWDPWKTVLFQLGCLKVLEFLFFWQIISVEKCYCVCKASQFCSVKININKNRMLLEENKCITKSPGHLCINILCMNPVHRCSSIHLTMSISTICHKTFWNGALLSVSERWKNWIDIVIIGILVINVLTFYCILSRNENPYGIMSYFCSSGEIL